MKIILKRMRFALVIQGNNGLIDKVFYCSQFLIPTVKPICGKGSPKISRMDPRECTYNGLVQFPSQQKQLFASQIVFIIHDVLY